MALRNLTYLDCTDFEQYFTVSFHPEYKCLRFLNCIVLMHFSKVEMNLYKVFSILSFLIFKRELQGQLGGSGG